MRIKLFTKIEYNSLVDDYIIDFSHDSKNGFVFYYWDTGLLPEGVQFLIEDFVMEKFVDNCLSSLEESVIKIVGENEVDWKIEW